MNKKEKKRLREERARERKALKAAERKAKLEAFKSIEGIGDAIAFIFGYGKTIAVSIGMFAFGYLFSHFHVINLLLKKFGIIQAVVK